VKDFPLLLGYQHRSNDIFRYQYPCPLDDGEARLHAPHTTAYIVKLLHVVHCLPSW